MQFRGSLLLPLQSLLVVWRNFGVKHPGLVVKPKLLPGHRTDDRIILGRELAPATRFPIQSPSSAIECQRPTSWTVGVD